MNKILMDKRVVNLIDNDQNQEFILNDNQMLIINIFCNNFNSFEIKTVQNDNSFVVINFAGFVNSDATININGEVLGNNNKYIVNFRGISQTGHGVVNACIHVKENTLNNEVVEDLKAIVEDGTINLMPILEIDTNEVNASHFATVGYYPLDQLFYLETKGISKEEGIKILKKNFLFNLFDKSFLKQIDYGKEQNE